MLRKGVNFGKKMRINLLRIIDDSTVYELLREIRWAQGVHCPHCHSLSIRKNGHDEVHKARQKYECKTCLRGFDDLTGTVFSGSNKSLKIWVVCLYFMGLNLSNAQIANELDLSYPTAQRMTKVLRQGIVKKSLILNLAEKLRQMKYT